MYGYVRLILSMLVVMGHVAYQFPNYNQAVSAVVIFFLLAGFVTQKLLIKINYDWKKFYAERFLRIYPYFWFVTALYFVVLGFLRYDDFYFSWKNIFANASILPLNFIGHFDMASFKSGVHAGQILNGPSWSLSLELQAYLVLPFILKKSTAKLVAGLASFLIFILANIFSAHPAFLGFYTLPGMLFCFIIGGYISSSDLNETKSMRWVGLIYLGILASSILMGIFSDFTKYFTKDVFIGLLIGIPLVVIIKQMKIHNVVGDRLAGNLSYGIYISHTLVTLVLAHYNVEQRLGSHFLYLLGVLIPTFAISLLATAIVDRSLEPIRFKMTKTPQ